MKYLLALGFFAFNAFYIAQASAAEGEDRACLIEGSFNILGRTIHSKDCMQSNPKEEEESFKKSCEEFANSSAMLGGAPGKITYMKQCKRPAQGVCRGFLGTGRDAYYYQRSGDDLRDLPSNCAKGGGRWTSE